MGDLSQSAAVGAHRPNLVLTAPVRGKQNCLPVSRPYRRAISKSVAKNLTDVAAVGVQDIQTFALSETGECQLFSIARYFETCRNQRSGQNRRARARQAAANRIER